MFKNVKGGEEKNAKKIRTIVEIIDYIKEIEGLKSDSDVARLLKLTPQALHNHITRESLPLDALVDYCQRESYSLEGVLFRDEPTFGPPKISIDPNADPKLFEIIKYLADHREVIDLAYCALICSLNKKTPRVK